MTQSPNTLMYDLFTQVGNPNGWNSADHQQDNFTKIVQLSNMCNRSLIGSCILDVGCGTGKLYEFLQPHQIGKYVGIDLYHPSLEIARQTYPQARFLEQNIVEPSVEFHTPFDYVFCSGALTTRVENNYTFLEQMVQRMDQLAIHGIYFNFLTKIDEDNADLLFAYDPSKVEAICHTLQRKVNLVKNSNHQEGHVFVYSKEQ